MEPLGLYIHIPFCKAKCLYCDFYSLPACTDERIDAYTDALRRHLSAFAMILRETGNNTASETAADSGETANNEKNASSCKTANNETAAGGGYGVDTVYFGGGTPSYLGGRRLLEIWDTVVRSFPVLETAEVTLEVNPESCGDWLSTLHTAGFNRISLGMQSACDEELREIGRVHDHLRTSAAVETVRRAGFDNLSLDLIYGLPRQTMARWRENVRAAVSLGPEHISCYGLKVEEGTALYKRLAAEQDKTSPPGEPYLPGEEEQAAFYLRAVEDLDRAGYGQYEISNFAKPGRASRHNLKYWTLAPYIGFGPGAHSDFRGVRFAWPRNLDGYLRAVRETDGHLFPDGQTPFCAEYTPVPETERAREYVMLGLRTTAGLDRAEYVRRFEGRDHNGAVPREAESAMPSFDRFLPFLEQCRRAGYAVRKGDRWRLTPHGFLVSNRIIGELLDLFE